MVASEGIGPFKSTRVARNCSSSGRGAKAERNTLFKAMSVSKTVAPDGVFNEASELNSRPPRHNFLLGISNAVTKNRGTA